MSGTVDADDGIETAIDPDRPYEVVQERLETEFAQLDPDDRAHDTLAWAIEAMGRIDTVFHTRKTVGTQYRVTLQWTERRDMGIENPKGTDVEVDVFPQVVTRGPDDFEEGYEALVYRGASFGATLDSNGRFRVPAAARNALDIDIGDELEVFVNQPLPD
jgi:bifunctional DNA-binding transcriptional regulator/antitoxin component of YhaV-PrlF toxin-antitoxin module